jgi:hypothetical protein
MDKKFIFFDIDGTLLDDNKEVLESTRETLTALSAAGHDLAIATGRNALMADGVIKDLAFNHYIVCNGAEAFYNHETAYKNPLDQGALHRLIERADAENHPIVYETAHELLRRSKEVSPRMVDGMQYVGYDVPDYDDSGRFHYDNELIQLLLFIDDEDSTVYRQADFPEFRFVRWYEAAVDVLPATGSKYETISILAEQKGYDHEDIITVGDGNNDFEMIQKSGYGIAMANGEPHVKEVADLVTHSNNDHGIYKAFKRLDLI